MTYKTGKTIYIEREFDPNQVPYESDRTTIDLIEEKKVSPCTLWRKYSAPSSCK